MVWTTFGTIFGPPGSLLGFGVTSGPIGSLLHGCVYRELNFHDQWTLLLDQVADAVAGQCANRLVIQRQDSCTKELPVAAASWLCIGSCIGNQWINREQ